jgi:hypothetical protein
MNKKKRIITAGILLLFAVVAGWLVVASHQPPVVVVGSLSKKDVADLTAAVRRQMWHNTLPNFTWKSLSLLPGKLLRNATCHISGIYGDSNTAVVLLASRKSKPPVMVQAQKLDKGWVCYGGF